MRRFGITSAQPLIVSFLLLLCVPLLASETDHFQLVQYESLGLPAIDKQVAARKISDLIFFNDRLYLGHGDAVVNTGPTDIIYYNPLSGEFKTEFTVDDEAIYRYRVVDGQLVIPGPDATEEWDFGNIYVLKPTGWTKYRTIPNGIHVNDIITHQSSWYVSTGCFFQFSPESDESYPFGGIFRSDDAGETWRLVYATPYDEKSVYRVGSLVSFRDKLYSFLYSLVTYKVDDIPTEFQASLGKSYEGGHIILGHDLLGAAEAIAFDGIQWSPVDLVPTNQVCTVTPILFKDQLVLSVLSGPYLDYFQLRVHIPAQARTQLFSFDGEKTSPIELEYDDISDILLRDQKLFFLLKRKQQTWIAETSDLFHWKYYRLSDCLTKTLSLEYDGTFFYLGQEDGNIFKATAAVCGPESRDSFSIYPLSFHGTAELPEEGRWYWTAITDWQQWAMPATVKGSIRSENLLQLTTSNVAGLLVFPPWPNLDSNKPIHLRINDDLVFKGVLKPTHSLQCSMSKAGIWKAEKVKVTDQDFTPTTKIAGRSEVNLLAKGYPSLYGTWKAEVLKSAARADIALVSGYSISGDVQAGPITLEDLFQTNTDERLCTFSMKGCELKALLEYNIKLPEADQLHIAGFTMTVFVGADQRHNRLLETSLDDQTSYRVVVSDTMMRYSTSTFGQTVAYDLTPLKVRSVLFQWLETHHTIGPVTLPVTLVTSQVK